MFINQNNLVNEANFAKLTEIKEEMVKNLTEIFFHKGMYEFKFSIYQFITLAIDIDVAKSQTLTNYLSNCLSSLISFLTIKIESEYKNEIVLSKQFIIDLVIYAFSKYRSGLQYWIKQNNIVDKICDVLNDNNKILTLEVIKFIRSVFDYGDFFFCYDIVDTKLMELLINLFNKNKKKDNAIFAAVCSFFNSLIEKEKLLNQFVILNRQFFYEEDNYLYFENIIAKIERRPEKPKPIIIDYNVKAKQEEEKKIDSEIVNEAKAAWPTPSKDIKEETFLGKKRQNEDSLNNIIN